jgi:hypothetical protein
MDSFKLNRCRPCKFYFSRSRCLKGDACTYSHLISEIGFSPKAVTLLEAEYRQDPLVFERMVDVHPVEKW